MSAFYNVDAITDRVYLISGKENTNAQLVVGEEKALLFDNGYGLGDLRGEIRKITSLPILVVNSHGHLDHINGNYQFEGPIYIHKQDEELANMHSNLQFRMEAVENGKHFANFVTGTQENILPEGFDEEAYINAKMPDYSFVEEGDVFDLGGIRLQVVHFPGHTAGSIGLWDADNGVLLLGDAMNAFTWLFADEATTLTEYKNTLYKAKALAPKILLAGHALGPIPVEDLDAYIDCAENLDYEKGIPFENNILPGADVRVCVREGYAPMEFDKPGYASIVVSPSHIC